MVGGAAVTEEFHPGFRNSVAAYTVSLLNPQDHRRPASCTITACASSSAARRISCPAPDGSYLLTGEGRTQASVAKLSKRDAGRIDGFIARARSRSPTCCAHFVLRAPPNLVEGFGLGAIREALQRARHRQHPARALRWSSSACCSICSPARPARCWTQRFENDLVKALFGFDAIVGNYASPYAAGSAYVMLHHAFGEVNGKKGVWGHAIGGMGAITQAMAASARGHGAEIETGAGVREVLVERDRAVGVIARRRPRPCARNTSSPTSIRSCCIRG